MAIGTVGTTSYTSTTIVPTQRDIDVWRLEAENAIRFDSASRLGRFNWPMAVLSLIAALPKADAHHAHAPTTEPTLDEPRIVITQDGPTISVVIGYADHHAAEKGLCGWLNAWKSGALTQLIDKAVPHD